MDSMMDTITNADVPGSIAGLPTFTVDKVARKDSYLQRLSSSQRERLRWHESLLQLPAVWRKTQGEDVRVAILDTGIDSDHPDLKDAVIGVRDFTGEGIEDGNGHGTHCAGIVAARENSIGFVGAAPKAELLIGKVLRNDGRGWMGWITAGINWALDQGADIISMSLGAPVGNSQLHMAVHSALADGAIMVCAAGNSGHLFSNSIDYPGRYGSVISVGSHDRNGMPSGFSSRGGEIDFLAPGDGIWSTYKNGSYARLSGTSMATPFVAGLAALILARHRQSSVSRTPINNTDDMREHLARMAAHPGHHDSARGYGPLLPFSYFSKMD
jgi:subtilisin family serine protease